MQASNTLSKSQKRKQRIAKKAIASAKPKVTVSVQPASSSSRKRRPRRSRRAARAIGVISYDRALKDPVNAEGCKVPDMIAYPTGTFQLVQYVNLPLLAGGDSFGVQFYPIIGDGSTAFPIGMLQGTTAGSLATRTTANWGERSAITALYSLFRPVSACVELFYTGKASDESGEMGAGCTWYPSVGTPPTTYGTILNLPEMKVFDLEGHTKVLWKPLDNSHLTFQPVTGPASTGGAPAYPQIFIVLSGLQTGSTAHCTITCNFEAIPDSGQGNLIETEPSPYDPSALRRAWEWAQSNESTVIHGLEFAGRAANAIGLNPFTNWNRFQLPSRNPQRARIRGSSSTAYMMSHVAKDLELVKKSGKEEEDDDFIVAERKFNEMLVSESKPSIETALKIATPRGSPISLRRAQ